MVRTKPTTFVPYSTKKKERTYIVNGIENVRLPQPGEFDMLYVLLSWKGYTDQTWEPLTTVMTLDVQGDVWEGVSSNHRVIEAT